MYNSPDVQPKDGEFLTRLLMCTIQDELLMYSSRSERGNVPDEETWGVSFKTLIDVQHPGCRIPRSLCVQIPS